MTPAISPVPIGVFISHRHVDAPLAERLAGEISKAGHRVWLDQREILVGDSIVERINAGLENVQYVVVCYSEAVVHSNWMSREWMSVLARQLNGCHVRLLPVRFSAGSPPAILADIRVADLVNDWDLGVQELLKSIR